MPIRTFWSFVKNCPRIQSEIDLRNLDIAQAANAPEYAKTLREKYIDTIGKPIKEEGVPMRFREGDHSSGIAKLKGLMLAKG